MTSKDRKEVIKHSSAIQVSNKVNLLQRRTWNILLANAFNELDTKEIFQINITDLCKTLKYESRNDKHLKKLLRELMDIKIEWNLLNKDKKKEWGAMVLLAEVKIINGVLFYAYPPSLRKSLHNPNVYAKINLKLQNKFKSKHSLALYELFVDYFHCGETPVITIQKFRELLGLKKNEYVRFNNMNQTIIKKSIQEINTISNLYITVEYYKQSRKVVGFKFFITKNPNAETNLIELNAIPKEKPTEKQLSLPVPEFELANQELFQILINEFGISNNKADEFLKTKDEFYLEEILEHVKEQIKKGTIKNIPAYTVSAIENDYRTKKSQHEIEKEKEAERKEQAKKEKQLLEKLKQEFDEYSAIQTDKVLTELSESEKEKHVASFEKEQIENSNSYTKKFYKDGGINHVVIEAMFNAYIAEKILPPEDREFIEYAKAKGYEIKQAQNNEYKFVQSPE
jgi:hypothetical protein